MLTNACIRLPASSRPPKSVKIWPPVAGVPVVETNTTGVARRRGRPWLDDRRCWRQSRSLRTKAWRGQKAVGARWWSAWQAAVEFRATPAVSCRRSFSCSLLLLIQASVRSTQEMKRWVDTDSDAAGALMYTCVPSAYKCPTSPALAMISNNSVVYNRNRVHGSISQRFWDIWRQRIQWHWNPGQASLKMTPFDCMHMVSYYGPIVTLCLKCIVGRKSPKTNPTHLARSLGRPFANFSTSHTLPESKITG